MTLIYLQSGQFNEDMIPTVGFNMRKVTKGNVTIKVCRVYTLPQFGYHINATAARQWYNYADSALVFTTGLSYCPDFPILYYDIVKAVTVIVCSVD